MIDVWCERLTLPVLLRALLMARGRRCRLFAAEVGRWAGVLLKRLPGVDLHPVVVEMGAVDERGRVLRYRIEAEVARASALVMERMGPLSALLPQDHRAHEDDWRRLLRAHLMAHFHAALTFFSFATNCYRTGAVSGADSVAIILAPRFLARALARVVEPRIGLPCRVLPWTSALSFASFHPLPGLVGHMLLQAVLAWRAGPPPCDIKPEAAQSGAVLEQYCVGGLHDYPEGGHLYWHRGSAHVPGRVVMYCNRHDSPPDDEALALFKRHGFGWLDGRQPLRHLDRPLSHALRRLAGMLTRLPWAWSEGRAWAWLHVFQNLLYVDAYRAMARRLGVRVLHQNEEQFARPLALVLAVRMEDGLFFWNHWSVSHFPVAREAAGMADLLLAWGPYDAGFRSSFGFRFRHLVRTGTVYANAMDEARREQGRALAQSLAPAVTFRLVVFDSSHGPASHQPTATLAEFLRGMVLACAAHPHWGMLFKGKAASSAALLDQAGVAAELARLEAEGRFIRLPTSLTVEVAALAGHATVSYGINSAGVIASMLSGCRSVHWDVAAQREHLLYRLGGEGRLVFKDGASLLAALERLEQGGDIGDFSPYAALFDSFGDHGGNQRAGALLGGYLAGRDRGLDRDAALDAAVAAYGEAWGADKLGVADDDAARAWRGFAHDIGFPVVPAARAEAAPSVVETSI